VVGKLEVVGKPWTLGI